MARFPVDNSVPLVLLPQLAAITAKRCRLVKPVQQQKCKVERYHSNCRRRQFPLHTPVAHPSVSQPADVVWACLVPNRLLYLPVADPSALQPW